MAKPVRVLPMKTAGTHHFIERIYREGGTFQWVREALTNAFQAGAKNVEFGVEWQAVEQLGVYRRVIADDGSGMSAAELVEFFNTFGGGGKPIGGPHENFGVGAKTSLLPWNQHGVVVISWQNEDAAMIWVLRDQETGEYGLRVFQAEDPDTGELVQETVVAPFLDDEHGCDWATVGPDWVRKHGTVLVLLGNGHDQDTVLGDPSRPEADIKGISGYLNRRIWSIPEGAKVFVDELRTTDRKGWPRSEDEAHGPTSEDTYDRRTNRRKILGARAYIDYSGFTRGKLGASSTVELSTGVKVNWFLWSGERPAVQSYASIGGFIGVLYENELYDLSSQASLYRSFGITEMEVRKALWLIVEPPLLAGEEKLGVYPRTDRNSLLMRGGPSAGEPLPLADWGAEFADIMPAPILEALRKARGAGSGTIADPTWRERLAERFGSLWKMVRLRAKSSGQSTVDAIQPGSAPRPLVAKKVGGGQPGGEGGRGGSPIVGKSPGSVPAAKTRVAGGIPTYLRVRAQDMDEPWMFAAWQPNHPEHPEGAVLLNVEHPVLEAEILRWQAMYPEHLADGIKDEVIDVYGQVAVAKVAHSEQLKAIMPRDLIEKELRACSSLTMALLGLLAEEAVLSTRIGGKFGRKRNLDTAA